MKEAVFLILFAFILTMTDGKEKPHGNKTRIKLLTQISQKAARPRRNMESEYKPMYYNSYSPPPMYGMNYNNLQQNYRPPYHDHPPQYNQQPNYHHYQPQIPSYHSYQPQTPPYHSHQYSNSYGPPSYHAQSNYQAQPNYHTPYPTLPHNSYPQHNPYPNHSPNSYSSQPSYNNQNSLQSLVSNRLLLPMLSHEIFPLFPPSNYLQQPHGHSQHPYTYQYQASYKPAYNTPPHYEMNYQTRHYEPPAYYQPPAYHQAAQYQQPYQYQQPPQYHPPHYGHEPSSLPVNDYSSAEEVPYSEDKTDAKDKNEKNSSTEEDVKEEKKSKKE